MLVLSIIKKTIHSIAIVILFSIWSCTDLLNKPAIHTHKSSLNYDSLLERRLGRVKERYCNKLRQIEELRKRYPNMDTVKPSFNVNSYRSNFNNHNDSIFYQNRQISLTTFHEEITCQATTLSSMINFDNCSFLNKIDLSFKLVSDMTFFADVFNGPVNIIFSEVEGYTSFNRSEFKNNFLFNRNKVSDVFESSFANFSKGASFTSDTFYDEFKFNTTILNGIANFENTRFEGNVDFRDLRINDSSYLNFKEAVLPSFLDFSFNNKIKSEIDLTNASFSDSLHYNKYNDRYFNPHYISLYKSDITKFHLDYIHFRLATDSGLILDELGNIKKKIKLPKDDVAIMYEALLNNFKNRGQAESYKLLDIEYQEYKWENSGIPYFSVFSKYWWNYGYNKEKIFLWTPFYLLFFTLLNFFHLKNLNEVYPLNNMGQIPSFNSRRFTVIDSLKRMWLAFVYTSAIFFKLTLKVESINYRRVWGTLYIFLVYTVGIICLAYMANFIIQK